MDDDALERSLRQLGLSEKEVATYLTLLEHGEAKASTIAEAADVSKRYVYSVSERLAERGFVTLNDHRVPATVRANPPEEVLDRLRSDLESMRPALEARYTQAAPREETFEVIRSRATLEKRIVERIENATEEVALAIPAGRLGGVRDALTAAVDRGVLVLLLVSGVDPDERVDLSSLASVARTWTETMPSLLTADGSLGLVAPAEMVHRANSGEEAIGFFQRQLAPVLVGSMLGNYWPMATEVYRAEPVALPRSFGYLQHAVLQATLHRAADHSLVAEVTGHRVETGDPVAFEGPLVAVRQGLVEPVNNEFPVENALVVGTDRGRISVGGRGAFVEDVQAESVTLRREDGVTAREAGAEGDRAHGDDGDRGS